jgi:hypothetical protein
MVWMEVEHETNPNPRVLLLFCLAFPLVPLVWWYSGWVNGFFAWFGVSVAVGMVDSFVAAWRIPPEARGASKLAVEEFRRLHSTDTVKSVAVRAVEPERFVFSVRYETPNTVSFPTARRYFAVSRAEPVTATELAVENWWPRGLK